MYKDFIVKQTSDFDSQFKAKTLVGNWYEERCNPGRPDNFHYFKERRNDGDLANPTLSEVQTINIVSKTSKFQPRTG